MPPTSFPSSLISLTQGSRIISILTLSLWYVFVYLDSRVDVAKYLFFPWYSIILSFRRIVNMATRDSMASYAIAFLRQGTDNLMNRTEKHKSLHPSSRLFFYQYFRRFYIFVQSLSCEILISLVRDMDLSFLEYWKDVTVQSYLNEVPD